METREVREQLAYWEAQEKDCKATIQSHQNRLKHIQAAIKSLKAFLPKSKEESKEVVVEENQDNAE